MKISPKDNAMAVIDNFLEDLGALESVRLKDLPVEVMRLLESAVAMRHVVENSFGQIETGRRMT